MDVAVNLTRNSQAHGAALVAHLDGGQVKGVEEELDADPDQGRIDFIVVAEEAHRGGLSDHTCLRPEKGVMELSRQWPPELAAGQPALQRSLPSLAVWAAVVDALQPGSEQFVQLLQVLGATAGLELDQELRTHCPEEALDLATAGGVAGAGVNDADAERGQGAMEGRRDERRAVVYEHGVRDPGRLQSAAQGSFQAHGVLGVAPTPAGDAPAPVVDEGKEDCLGPTHHRTV